MSFVIIQIYDFKEFLKALHGYEVKELIIVSDEHQFSILFIVNQKIYEYHSPIYEDKQDKEKEYKEIIETLKQQKNSKIIKADYIFIRDEQSDWI